MKNKTKKKRRKFTYEGFKSYIKKYTLFNVMLAIALGATFLTLWNKRPNSMRKPLYANTKDYNLVEGAFDFSDFYEILETEKNASIKNIHFRLEEDYCFHENDVDLCFKGYELIETDAPISINSSFRLKSSKYILVARIDIVNNRENSISASEFSSARNRERGIYSALNDKDLVLENNLAEYGYKELTVKSKETYEGIIAYSLSSAGYRDLYFDGSLIMDMPQISDSSKIGSHYLFTQFKEINLEVIDGLIQKQIQTANNLSMNSVAYGKGFTTVDEPLNPNIEVVSDDESVTVMIKRIEQGYFKYRPDVIKKSKYDYINDGKMPYESIKINLKNTGSSVINTNYLAVKLGVKSESIDVTSSILSRGMYIEPGESVDLVFSHEISRGKRIDYKVGNEYRFVLMNDDKEKILEIDFKLEEEE